MILAGSGPASVHSTVPTRAASRSSPTGQTVNALLGADIRTDIDDGACCNAAFCDVAYLA